MTAVLEDLRSLTEDELLSLLTGEDDASRAAAAAELRRREHEHDARQRRQHGETDLRDMVHAQYEDAVRECNGTLMNARGQANEHLTDEALWYGPRWLIEPYISEELRNYWLDHPRRTISDLRAQEAASRRDERETAAAETAALKEAKRDMGIGRMIVHEAVRSAQNAQRHPGGMTQEQYQQNPAIQRARERIKAQREQREAAAALRDMAAERQAHQRVAVPGQSGPATVHGTAVARTEREPIDGAAVLDYVRLFLERFAVWPSEAALDAAVLWAAHTHARDDRGLLVWQYTPRWLFLSSEPGSGKSWMLKLMLKLSAQGKLLVEPTPAAVARSVGLQKRTIGLDEGDVLWGQGSRNAQIRAIINMGYEPDGEWSRATKGTDTADVPVFGPLAMAGLDKITKVTGDSLRAMLDRFIKVRVHRAPEGYRPPRFDDKARAVAAALSNGLAAWCVQERDGMRDAIPEVPEGLGNRPAALWEPLLAVADAAGGRWPEAARVACEELTASEGLPGSEGLDELDAMMAGWE